MTNVKEISEQPLEKAVGDVFLQYPPNIRIPLLKLRQMILETAAKTDGVGQLEETLKWGQPSYLTSATKSGTTIRIGVVKNKPSKYALYVNCQTNLIETYRELYRNELRYEGKRAIIFEIEDKLPDDIVRHCIALALTYHRNKALRHL